jgi:hypothetical protein
VEARARKQAVWSRVHPDRPFPWAQLPAQVCSLDVDSLCEHAEARGALIERRPVGEDFMERQPDELAPLVLGGLPLLSEDLLVVSDELRCFRVPGAELTNFVLRDANMTGEASFSGDELFVCTTTRHIVLLHHSGYVFDIRP